MSTRRIGTIGMLAALEALPQMMREERESREAEDAAEGHPGERRGFGTQRCRKCGGKISLNKEYHFACKPKTP